uniref:Uncharacterized protein n=2 Tax=Kalanchoe fedtschenkoi TaxID=63787 RepID=A0A7N0UV49_KALFE
MRSEQLGSSGSYTACTVMQRSWWPWILLLSFASRSAVTSSHTSCLHEVKMFTITVLPSELQLYPSHWPNQVILTLGITKIYTLLGRTIEQLQKEI